jgi:hypothetical protein
MDRGAGRDGAVNEPKSLDEALLILQADPPVLAKTKSGQVGNQKTKYADLVEVNKVVLSRLNGLGITWVCLPTLLPDTASGPGKFVLRYSLLHVASGEHKTGDWPLGAGEPQKMGSAVTYARRYALLAVTGIAAEDEDDDGDAASGRQYAQRAAQQQRRQRPAADPEGGGATAQRAPQRPRSGRPPLPGENVDPAGPIGQDQRKHMFALWRELGYDGDENRETRLAITAKILGLPELESSSDLTRADGSRLIDALIERKERTAGEPS